MGRLGVFLVGLLLAAGLAGCGGSTDTDLPDFKVVPYQPGTVLGAGEEVSIARAFEPGKPVVLNFWAAQCPPCRAEMPAFQAIADRFEGEVLIVGVDVGAFTALGTREGARQLIAELSIRYPTAAAVDSSALKQFTIQGMPTTVFLSADGTVVEKTQGAISEDELRSTVEKLIAASS